MKTILKVVLTGLLAVGGLLATPALPVVLWPVLWWGQVYTASVIWDFE